MTIQLFIPCYVDQFAPQTAQALCSLLDRLKVSWRYPADQTCCGQFAFNAGNWPAARRLMRHFFKVFDDSGPILCPSASCVLTLRQHYPRLVASAADAAHLQRLLPLVQEFSEWLAPLLPLPFPLNFPHRVFLHQSCASRQLGLLPQVQSILNSITGLHLLTLPTTYSCCGFGGLFALKQPRLSRTIGTNYLQAALATGAEAMVSADVACLLHLHSLLPAPSPHFPVFHLSELILAASQDRDGRFLT